MALMGVDDQAVEGGQTSADSTENVLERIDTTESRPVKDPDAPNLAASAPVLSVVPPPGAPSSSSTETGEFPISSSDLDTVDPSPKLDQAKSALVSKVLKKAREAAAGTPLADLEQRSTGSHSSDQRATGSNRFDQKNTGTTRLPDQRSTGSTRLPDQRSTGSVSRLPDQRSTGSVSRLPDQRTTGSVSRLPDQRNTGVNRMDQSVTGSTRFNDQKSTGSTPSYVDQTTTGTVRALIGRERAEPISDEELDENAPANAKKSLAATIETEAKKSKIKKVSLLEKVVTAHPILVGVGAFCVFVLPVYAFIVNAQSPTERAEYQASLGKDVKLIANKLRKPGEYNGHKIGFYVNRADAYMKSSEFQSAISDLKIARQLDVTKADDCNIKLAQCYLKLKDFKNASTVSAEVLKNDPSNVDALLLHARASYSFGNKLTALDDYFKAVKFDASNPAVYIERGDYYVAEKKQGSAAADYKHALELAPSLAEAKQKLAACTAVVARHSTSASDSAEQAAKLSPAAQKLIAESDFETLRAKGYQALQKGDLNFAIAALSRAVALNPNGALVRQYLAHALLANGEYDEAIAQLGAWDKLAKLTLTEKLAFARRFPEHNASGAALYDSLIKENAADAQALLTVAQHAQKQGYTSQTAEAIDAGLKVANPEQQAQLAKLRVAETRSTEADVASGKVKLEN